MGRARVGDIAALVCTTMRVDQLRGKLVVACYYRRFR